MKDLQRKFRDALGMFATGITVVTTCDKEGKPVGMTANSFASLSLDPPLLVWNAGDHSDYYEVFRDTDHFAVHVLHEGQKDISVRFSTKSEDKFAGLEWQEGEAGSPILDDYAVCFECTKEANYPGGDHLILVGRVVNFDDKGDLVPLIYHRGNYRELS